MKEPEDQNIGHSAILTRLLVCLLTDKRHHLYYRFIG